MDRYDEKAGIMAQRIGSLLVGESVNDVVRLTPSVAKNIAQFGRECAAEAFREAQECAQIEVNACEHHANAVLRGNVVHLAAGHVASVIVNFCKARAAALAPKAGEEKP